MGETPIYDDIDACLDAIEAEQLAAVAATWLQASVRRVAAVKSYQKMR